MVSETNQETNVSCPSCQKVLNTQENLEPEKVPGLPQVIYTVKCVSCDKCTGVILDQKFYLISDLLYDDEAIEKDDYKSKSRLALYILCEVIYKEYEVPLENLLEVEFICPPPTDFIKLLYINGVAVGFYSVKPKGKLDFETMTCYSMATLDTIFIRESKRRQGLGSSALEDLLAEFPDQNIGFSYPISKPMKQVLKKHLEKKPIDRLRFWEVTGCYGNQPDCRNLWLILETHKHQ